MKLFQNLTSGFRGNSRNISVTLFQNMSSGFGGDFLRIFSGPYSAKSPHSPQPCWLTDQNFAENFWLINWLNGVLRRFQQYFSHITARAHIIHVFPGLHQYYAGAQKCVAQGHSQEKTQRIQCSSNPEPLDYESNTLPLSHVGPRKIVEKGHPSNIPVKLFQGLTSSFREDILRFSCLYSARSSHSPEPCLYTDQSFANNFWKGSSKEHSCEIILKLDQQFQGRRFLKNCLKNSVWLPWQPEFWWNLILWTIFQEDLRRNISARFGPNWPSGFGGEDI